MLAATVATAAVLTVLLSLRWGLGYLSTLRASEAAERAQILSAASSAAERESATAVRALEVLAKSLEPVPPSPGEARRLELENAELERAQAFDLSDPFDDVAAVRPDAAALVDDEDGPFGVPGLRLAGRLDGEVG